MSSASEDGAPAPPPPPEAIPPRCPPPAPSDIDGSDGSDGMVDRRLHPAAIAVWPLQQAIGLVVLLVFGGASRWGWIAPAVGVVATVAYALVRWVRFRWTLQGPNLVIEQGVLQRQRRVIPADRVQSVDLISPLRHRLFGVVQVRVEAIGGSDTEGLLEALDRPTALALQDALIAARARARAADPRSAAAAGPGTSGTTRGPTGSGGPAGSAGDRPWSPGVAAERSWSPESAVTATGPAPAVGAAPAVVGTTPSPPLPGTGGAPRVLARVTPGSLVKAGLTGGRVGVVAVLLGGAQQVAGDRIEDAIDLVPSDVGLVVAAVVVALAAIAVFLVSVIATVVSYWGFTISRDDDELRISRGLLEQRLETVPIRRIQALRIEQNLLRRWLGLASVKADLAGRAGGGDGGTGLLLPVGPVAEAQRLVADLLGTEGPVLADLQPADPRSRRRWSIRGLACALPGAAIGAGAILIGAPLWAPAVGALLGALAGVPMTRAAWTALGRGEVEGVVVATSGVVVRRRVHVPVGRIQTMTVGASPFQRRLGLADVHIGIARSSGWSGPRLLEVDGTEAEHLVAATVHQAVEASRRPARRAAPLT